MKVLLSEIPPEGLRISWGELERPHLEGPKGTLEEGLRLASPLKGGVFLKMTKRGLLCKGNIDCSVWIHCARCLKEFRLPLRDEFEVVYVPLKEAPRQEEVELGREDMDVGFLGEDTIDLDELLNERIWLSLPMKPLCREDCKGLCPLCGKDLNEGDCGCSREAIDPRFAVLKELKMKLKG